MHISLFSLIALKISLVKTRFVRRSKETGVSAKETLSVEHRATRRLDDFFSRTRAAVFPRLTGLPPVLLIRSLLLCRDKDGVDVVEDRQWISLLMFEDSLALLDRLYRLSAFRQRLKRLIRPACLIDTSRFYDCPSCRDNKNEDNDAAVYLSARRSVQTRVLSA